ncbi:(S)-citramalyl-CoA lyase [Pseudomonas syringae]|uniref:HpcH/HpaI aldolase/citrate lyase family protein n=1 Tax=Pseudomonas syringae group TaxID=136849 RepID=UPI00089ACD93|nr:MULTISPECIES: CoA ester lyase [Pseudomonas syringae group]RMN40290.1 hypothetical protein ALQ59_200084 [Pseudomonas syringae pv. apii]RMN56170.1 hypothetical protein ALQ58_200211 [Pseudomonas syringae pv. apii]SDZ38734.1 (S)-citramalyl-CoA lyase [Pseudomonas syringae]
MSMPCKSLLFVPGSRPERYTKALACSASQVIIDFEDSVEEGLKVEARNSLGTFLESRPDVKVAIRVNAPGHPQFDEDLEFCASHVGVSGILIPKAEDPEQIKRARQTRKPIFPIIESARGLQVLSKIAQCEGVERLTFGSLDLSVDLRIRSNSAGAVKIMDQVRYELLIHSVLNGLAKPIDTVYPNIKDVEGLAGVARLSKDMGFAGLLCIHPSQVAIVNKVFAPSPDEFDWAKRVLAAALTEAGAFTFEGQMVDAPVLAEARSLVAAL